jgi:hypothetical protein
VPKIEGSLQLNRVSEINLFSRCCESCSACSTRKDPGLEDVEGEMQIVVACLEVCGVDTCPAFALASHAPPSCNTLMTPSHQHSPPIHSDHILGCTHGCLCHLRAFSNGVYIPSIGHGIVGFVLIVLAGVIWPFDPLSSCALARGRPPV